MCIYICAFLTFCWSLPCWTIKNCIWIGSYLYRISNTDMLVSSSLFGHFWLVDAGVTRAVRCTVHAGIDGHSDDDDCNQCGSSSRYCQWLGCYNTWRANTGESEAERFKRRKSWAGAMAFCDRLNYRSLSFYVNGLFFNCHHGLLSQARCILPSAIICWTYGWCWLAAVCQWRLMEHDRLVIWRRLDETLPWRIWRF